jgi:hypothetical protein
MSLPSSFLSAQLRAEHHVEFLTRPPSLSFFALKGSTTQDLKRE